MIPAEFPPMEVAGRIDRVRALLEAHHLDALLVTAATNIGWLTGFTGSHGSLLVSADNALLFTDGRYADQAPAQVAAAEVSADVVVEANLLSAITQATKGLARVGLEADTLVWAEQQRLAAGLGGELVPTEALVEDLRAIKDAGELARIRAAAAITDATLAHVVPMLAQRPTERDVALTLDHGLRKRGATNSAYETIVGSGPNSALPHAGPTDRTIEAGDMVVVDVGALVGGYRSDMTRTFVVGEPNAAQRRQLDVVQASQAAGVAVVKAGVPAKDVDTACREIIAQAGWAEAFSHGTGHGVGLDIHEQPRVNQRAGDVLVAGMVVTVEPGVYLAGSGGVRWEDLLHVTDTGAEVLTTSPKDPVLLPEIL